MSVWGGEGDSRVAAKRDGEEYHSVRNTTDPEKRFDESSLRCPYHQALTGFC